MTMLVKAGWHSMLARPCSLLKTAVLVPKGLPRCVILKIGQLSGKMKKSFWDLLSDLGRLSLFPFVQQLCHGSLVLQCNTGILCYGQGKLKVCSLERSGELLGVPRIQSSELISSAKPSILWGNIFLTQLLCTNDCMVSFCTSLISFSILVTHASHSCFFCALAATASFFFNFLAATSEDDWHWDLGRSAMPGLLVVHEACVLGLMVAI